MNVYSGTIPELTSINCAIINIFWEKRFAHKSLESWVSELNDLSMNSYSNYIWNKTFI